jgi:hypothetical protein
MQTTDLESYRRHWRARAAAAGADSTLVPLRCDEDPAFPDLCPACGAAAPQTLVVERACSLRVPAGEGHEEIHPVAAFPVRFCAACASRHRSERAPPGLLVPLKRLLGGDGHGIAGAVVFAIGLYFPAQAVKSASWVPLLFAALPFAVGGFLMRRNWNANRYLAVSAPTSVTAAVDWTADLALDCEPPWRAFRFARADYARRFREANASSLWQPHGDQARTARQRRRRREQWAMVIGTVAIGLAVSWWFYDVVIAPIVERLAR